MSDKNSKTGKTILDEWLNKKEIRGKVLLREIEYCPVCQERFLSLYPLSNCADHDGLAGV